MLGLGATFRVAAALFTGALGTSVAPALIMAQSQTDSGQGPAVRPSSMKKTATSPPSTAASAPKSQPTGRTASTTESPKASAKTKNGTTFVPVAYSDLPGWADDDHLAALKTFLKSCPQVIAATKAGKKSGPIPTPPELLAACEAALALGPKLTGVRATAFFEQHFSPHRVVHAAAAGLMTGYYEPILEGSRKKEGRFQTALYKRPPELVNIVDESQRGTVGKAFSHARMTPSGLVPFASRAEIEAGALNGRNLELLYVTDPVDAFFLQIQGSGRVRLTDGSMIRVNYDGKNGHPYSSIGRYLIDKGILAADKMSLGALSRWLKADPARARPIMHQNASYVFFREMPDGTEAPHGVLDIPLTTGRSLAVDPSVHALGSPVYVSAPTLTHALKGRPFHRLMVAQDVGSAIKGPERGDIYFGSGDMAGRLAGITKHAGHFFILKARAPSGAAAGKGAGEKTTR